MRMRGQFSHNTCTSCCTGVAGIAKKIMGCMEGNYLFAVKELKYNYFKIAAYCTVGGSMFAGAGAAA